MALWKPDPTFYPSPRSAMQAPRENLAYVAVLNPHAALNGNGDGRPDAIGVLDVDPGSETYGQVVGRVDLPNTGDELHHFGWIAKVEVDPSGGLTVDPDFFIEFDEGERPHQIRLEGGDSSSDSYCYVS